MKDEKKTKQQLIAELETLRESESSCRALLDAVPDMIFRTKRDGTYLEFVPGTDAEPLIPPEAFIGKKISDVLPAHLAEMAMRDTERALKTGDEQRHEYVLPEPDGEKIFEYRVVPVGNDEVIAIARDLTERRRADDELHMVRFTIDRSSDAAYWMGPDAGFTYVNDAACRSLGYSREQLLTMTVHDIDPLFPTEIWPAHWRELKKLGSKVVESKHRTRDGRIFPVEVSINHLAFQGREYHVAFARDITERNRADKALKTSEEMFRTLFETMAQGVVYQDAEGKITSANPASARILGLSLDQMQGRTSVDPRWRAIHEDGSDFPGDTHPSMVALRSGERVSDVVMEVFHAQEDRHRWININAAPQFDPDEDRPCQVYTIFEDITERKDAVEALRESGERLRTLVESVPVGIIIHAADTTVIHGNAAARRIMGLSLEEIVGKTATDFRWNFLREDGSDLPVEEYPVNQVLATKKPLKGFVGGVYSADTGDVTWLLVNSVPEFRADGAVSRVIVNFMDITEPRRAQEERRRLDARVQEAQRIESLSVLAGGVAHDFNNLLMGVLGNAELALQDLSAVSPARDSIEKVRTAALRAADLARQMLAYSGKGRFAVSNLNVSELVVEMDQLLKSSISNGASVDFQLADPIPAIRADETEIRQVVMNLMTNASEAIGDAAGSIVISTGVVDCESYAPRGIRIGDKCAGGRCVYAEVSDTGCGMDENTVNKMFDPFFTTKFTGRGLGLAAVQGIVRGHGGEFVVDSVPDEGTTIRVLFPALDEPAVTVAQDTAQPPAEGTATTVLLVDDEDGVLDVAMRMLTRAGCQVLTARDGPGAVRALKEHVNEIDCVLLDLTMPGMSGEETFDELRRIRDDVPVILASGYYMPETGAQVETGGFAAFVQKPYRSDELVRKIKEVLAQHN